MQFNVGFATDIGRKRSQNQDNMAALPEVGLFVVADGMGGHRGGETASQMAVETISEFVRTEIRKPDWNPRAVIVEAIRTANSAIHQRSSREPQLQGMGTTTTALLFKDERLVIGHVGDSRAYFFRPRAVWQATRDHSFVQEKLRAGLITRAEVKNDRMKNVITRSVGFEPQVNVEVYEMAVRPGDTFLVCSDGLSGLVDDLGMLAIVQRALFENRDIKRATGELIEAANCNGGDDNVTTIMIEAM